MFKTLLLRESFRNLLYSKVSRHSNLIHISSINQSIFGQKKRGPPRIAVLLSGCGALDGTEINEAVSILINANNLGLTTNFYAPDTKICSTINHRTRKPKKVNECASNLRNALDEAARIAGSSIKPLSACKSCENEALIIPGGYGAAITFSDFATKEHECIVDVEVERIVKDFNCAGKAIGCFCMASVVVARLLKGVKITLGKRGPQSDWPFADVINKVQKMGANVQLKDVNQVLYCKEFNVYSTPAFLKKTATPAEVHNSIGKLMKMVKKGIHRR